MTKYYTDQVKLAVDGHIIKPHSSNKLPAGVELNRSVHNTNCTQRSRAVFLALVEARKEHNQTRLVAKMLADALAVIEEEVPGNYRKTCWKEVDEALAAYERDYDS